MTTTDHYAIAFDLIKDHDTDRSLPFDRKIALAQVHATLALVEATTRGPGAPADYLPEPPFATR